MKWLLILANVLMAALFVWAIARALANTGFSGSAWDAFYYGSTLASLSTLAVNVIVLRKLL